MFYISLFSISFVNKVVKPGEITQECGFNGMKLVFKFIFIDVIFTLPLKRATIRCSSFFEVWLIVTPGRTQPREENRID